MNSKVKGMDEELREVWKWTGDVNSSMHGEPDPYLRPDLYDRVRRLLEVGGQFIGLRGEFGVGKSAMCQWLHYDFKDRSDQSAYISQGSIPGRVPMRRVLDHMKGVDTGEIWKMTCSSLLLSITNRVKKEKVERQLREKKIPADARELVYDTRGIKELSLPKRERLLKVLEPLLLEQERREIRRDSLLTRLSMLDHLFLDLPPYEDSDRKQEFEDMLGSVRDLWVELRQDYQYGGNLLTVVPSEVHAPSEVKVLDLEPFDPSRLFELYTRRFSGTFPFKENALRMLASVSDGNMRRFKQNIWEVLAKTDWEQPPIGEEFVRQKFTREIVKRYDLKDINCTEKVRKRLRNILAVLASSPEALSHKELIERMDIAYSASAAAMVSRDLKRLERAGYVEQRAEGNKRKVSPTL